MKFPKYSAIAFGLIAALCIIVPLFTGSATRMDLDVLNAPPSGAHLFGTDTLGRDIFKMIWHGGRVSLYIGLLATAISTLVAVVYGAAAGLSGEIADALLMRVIELLLSVPAILYIVALQAIFGKPGATSIAVVIGLTAWPGVAKTVRSEVLRVRRTEYVLSARQMGGGFIHILLQHLLPGFAPAVMFMIVSNIGYAIAAEATLSFMGLGLPPDTASWGSLMSSSQSALLTGSWWIIAIPGLFLVITLVCVTSIGEFLRKHYTLKESI